MRRDDAGRLAGEILHGLARPEGGPGPAEPLAYTLLARLVAQAKQLGVVLEQYVVGPWHVGEAELANLGRCLALRLPTVERGGYALPVRDLGDALEIVGLLNWCEVPEPQPS
jgi:hypothetical protein